VGSDNTKPYLLQHSSPDGFDEYSTGVWSRQLLTRVVRQSRSAERVNSFLFYSRGPYCRRVLKLHSHCLISWHSYGCLIKWRCDKSAIFFLCDVGCYVTKRQKKGLLNLDGTLRGSRIVESSQSFNDWYFGFSCTVQPSLLFSVAAKTLKDLMKSLCVLQLPQKEAWIYTLFLFLFHFLLVSALLSKHIGRIDLVIALSFRIFLFHTPS